MTSPNGPRPGGVNSSYRVMSTWRCCRFRAQRRCSVGMSAIVATVLPVSNGPNDPLGMPAAPAARLPIADTFAEGAVPSKRRQPATPGDFSYLAIRRSGAVRLAPPEPRWSFPPDTRLSFLASWVSAPIYGSTFDRGEVRVHCHSQPGVAKRCIFPDEGVACAYRVVGTVQRTEVTGSYDTFSCAPLHAGTFRLAR